MLQEGAFETIKLQEGAFETKLHSTPPLHTLLVTMHIVVIDEYAQQVRRVNTGRYEFEAKGGTKTEWGQGKKGQ